MAALLVATVGTVAVTRIYDVHPAGPSVWWAFPILALALGAAGYLRVRFRRGDDIDALTLFEAVLAPLIFAFSPTVVVLTVAGVQILSAALRRPSWIKAAFNVVQWSLAAAVGSAVL
ncbi:MAG: hypothetical protein ACRDP4_07420, partial [Nocardioidaceae bacterium]